MEISFHLSILAQDQLDLQARILGGGLVQCWELFAEGLCGMALDADRMHTFEGQEDNESHLQGEIVGGRGRIGSAFCRFTQGKLCQVC